MQYLWVSEPAIVDVQEGGGRACTMWAQDMQQGVATAPVLGL